MIEKVTTAAFTIPTERPESDGTLEWTSTTLIVVEIEAGGEIGFGYTYTHRAARDLIADVFFPILNGADPFAISRLSDEMLRAVRNLGRSGLAATAVSAVDCALWDLKCKLLGVPMADLIGRLHAKIPAYGSGGFTSYSLKELETHTADWIESGFSKVKMKVGRDPSRDPERVARIRRTFGYDFELYVDANGAYDRSQAARFAKRFAEKNVSWFEEPVSSDDLEGLAFVRSQRPIEIDIAAGEYGYTQDDFRNLFLAEAIDALQIDATRSCGVTGYLKAASLADDFRTPVSTHCAPTLHVPLGCATRGFRHLEYFYDHARIEAKLFDGFIHPNAGYLTPSREPGFGVRFKWQDARRFLVTDIHTSRSDYRSRSAASANVE